LRGLLRDLERVLDEVSEDPRLLPRHDHLEFRRLWSEARASLSTLHARLERVERGSDPALERTLADAGLDGASLDVKLAAVDRALAAFRASRGAGLASEPPFEGPPRSIRRAWNWMRDLRWARRPGRRARFVLAHLASLLRWINVPLESLVAALGLGEAVEEVKKWLEAAVADARELPEVRSGPRGARTEHTT
jgi:hypothetical protein